MRSSMKDLPPIQTKKIVKSPDKGSLLFADLIEPVPYEGWSLYAMNERALLTIVAALGCYNERPYDRSYSDAEKEEITFSHWAIDEILNLVWDHPFVLASDTVEEFTLKLQIYAITSVTEDQKRIFTIAANTALKLLEEIKEVER